MNVDSHIARVLEQHAEYYDLLRRKLSDFGPPPSIPDVKIQFAVSKAAGKYYPGKNICEYSIAYNILFPQHTSETIAHELVHAFAKKLQPTSKWHGDFFLFLMRNVAGFPNATRFHKMSAAKVRPLGELLTLQYGVTGDLIRIEETHHSTAARKAQ